MTREEAINMLYGMRADNLNLDDVYTKDKYEAISMAIEILENQKSFIEELEKIKEEIEKLNNTDYGSMFSYESHQGAGYIQDDIINIIEKHISEIKGEKK